MSKMTVVCSGCGQVLAFAPGSEGKRAKCPKCGVVVQIPASAAEMAQGPAPGSHAETKSCPYCGEEIKAVAIVCRHCGMNLETGVSTQAAAPQPEIGPVGDAAAAVAAPKSKRTLFGPIGLFFFFVAWVFFMVLQHSRFGEGWILPVLGALASIGSLGLALILSVVGIFLDGRKGFAIICAVFAGLTVLAIAFFLISGAMR